MQACPKHRSGRRPWRSAYVTPSILAVSATIALVGCTTTGQGTAQSANGAVTATISYVQNGGTSGTMTANLSTGDTYQGPFFEVTQQTNVDEMGPIWAGWEGRGQWLGWDGWGPEDSFATKYTGKVLANLDGAKGHARCRFTLQSPASGMDGGGLGRCQLPDGTIIHAQFPAH